jgi:urease accessory protein
VFGTLVWAAPMAMGAKTTAKLLEGARADREGLTGTMRCGALNQGLIARYSGTSSRDARFWFSRIWERTRRLRGLTTPRIPRVWPLQEQPLRRQTSTVNAFEAAAETH